MGLYLGSVEINASIEAVFDFHTDTSNLPLISPPWMKVRSIQQEGEGLGKRISIVISQFGIFRNRWIVAIEEYDRPRRITDLVIKGPMKRFRHARTFSSPQPGITLLQDRLEYELPFGLFGKIADRIGGKFFISMMFEYRHRKTKEILETAFHIDH